MEFLDEYESRPRFLFQSKQLHQQPSGSDRDPQSSSISSISFLSSLHKPSFIASILLSLVIFTIALLYVNFDPLQSLLLWLSLSFLIGPFAPPSLTAGDIRVGVGPPLKEEVPEISNEFSEKPVRKSWKGKKKVPEDAEVFPRPIFDSSSANESNRSNDSSSKKLEEKSFQEQSEWSEADDELLRKLMGKHPVGKPGRWEAIAEGFKGRFKVETIVCKSKEMGERKVSDQDSYKKFLKDRKPVDKRVIDEGENEANSSDTFQDSDPRGEGGKSGWTSAEDLALLNALKTFPKDVAMRWEKIAASVPGKTKAACMKRVTELKKDFRSSKASSSSGQAA